MASKHRKHENKKQETTKIVQGTVLQCKMADHMDPEERVNRMRWPRYLGGVVPYQLLTTSYLPFNPHWLTYLVFVISSAFLLVLYNIATQLKSDHDQSMYIYRGTRLLYIYHISMILDLGTSWWHASERGLKYLRIYQPCTKLDLALQMFASLPVGIVASTFNESINLSSRKIFTYRLVYLFALHRQWRAISEYACGGDSTAKVSFMGLLIPVWVIAAVNTLTLATGQRWFGTRTRRIQVSSPRRKGYRGVVWGGGTRKAPFLPVVTVILGPLRLSPSPSIDNGPTFHTALSDLAKTTPSNKRNLLSGRPTYLGFLHSKLKFGLWYICLEMATSMVCYLAVIITIEYLIDCWQNGSCVVTPLEKFYGPDSSLLVISDLDYLIATCYRIVSSCFSHQ
ncbi:hypothetical protein AAG570_004235 [Ranatra chinensis]|uniref:Gustatory receptor n=1 Tax=Ranatra chinensis TaxID=642074 RepID=A0ABD0Y365_9HEMI